MSSRNSTPYGKVVNLFLELKREHPNLSIGQHIATAFSDYGDLWTVPDKEFLFALEKYQAELQLSVSPISTEEEIKRIIEEGKNLDKLFKNEDDYE